MVGVLALQGAVRAHVEALEALGATAVEVRTPAQLAEVDALVVPGGESTAVSKLLDSSGLSEPLTDRLHDGMAAFGTCAGMILLARHVAGGRPDQRSYGAIDITVRRNAFGSQVDSFETDIEVDGFDHPFPGVFIRAPSVEEASPDVEVLATFDSCPVLCRQGPVLVSAFHPELSGDVRLHELFLSRIP